MKIINPSKMGIDNRLLIAIMMAVGIVHLLFISVYFVFRFVTHEKTLQERAYTAFTKLHDTAERALVSGTFNYMTDIIVESVDHEVVRNIQIYKTGEKVPLWDYGDFHDIEDIHFFEFSITNTNSKYSAFSNTTEVQSATLDIEEKQIGEVRIAIADDIFENTEIRDGLILVFLLHISLIAAITVSMRICKRGVSKPINAILIGLRLLGKGNFTTPIEQTDCSEIGQIQKELEELRRILDESSRRERVLSQSRIDTLYYMEKTSKAITDFISILANQILASLKSIKCLHEKLSSTIDTSDPMVENMLELADNSANEAMALIHKLVSTEGSPILDIPLHYEAIDMEECLNPIIEGCSFLTKRKSVDLRLIFKSTKKGENDIIYSDREKVEHIIKAIINHVILRSRKGSVLVESVFLDETWCLTIIDTNSNIHESEFNTVVSLEKVLKKETLYLSAAVLLIYRLRGSIEVKTGSPTTVKLCLPSNQKEYIRSSVAIQIDKLLSGSTQKGDGES